jgi:hypothetical protein
MLYGPASFGELFESGPVDARRRIWGSFDYIYWIAKGDTPPVLVTASQPGTPQAIAGVLNVNGTQTLFGAGPLNDGARSGAKFEFGGWLDNQRTFGIQAGAFFIQNGIEGSTFASGGAAIIARPFFSTVNGPSSQLVSFSDALGNVVSGAVTPREVTAVEGFDVAFRSLGCCGPCWRFDTLIGYRYFHLTDHLGIAQNLLVGPRGAQVGAPPGAVISSIDEFDADNTFHGAEIGVTGEYRFWDRWSIDGTVKASYGQLNQKSVIGGVTTASSGPVMTSSVGGLLALNGTNIGTFARSEGQLMPELNLNLGYDLNDRIRLRVGYSFIYLDNVFRAGQRIDTTVNPFYVPNNPTPGSPLPVRPSQLDLRTEYYLHGFNAGLEIRF